MIDTKFLYLQDFFLNRGLSFESSESDFHDQLDELFHMVKKIKIKKSKFRSYCKVPFYINHIWAIYDLFKTL